MNGVINWGIIGCGDVCEVKSGPAFNLVPNSKLVAVMRRDKVKAEDFARRHNVPRFYDSAIGLLNDHEVNAIYIATPPSSHEEYVEQALVAGKPVYVEKPVSLNASSCRRMIGLSERFSGRVSVAHYRRRLPLFQKVRALVLDGTIGKVRLIRLTVLQPAKSKIINQKETYWRVNPEISGGGLFNDLSPHQLDIMCWIFGRPVSVTGRSLNQSGAYNAPDLTMLEAIFEKDVCLQGVWSFNVPEIATEDCCEIIGDAGTLKFSFFKPSTLEVASEKGVNTLEFQYPAHVQEPMIHAVTKYFRDEDTNPCSLEDALMVMEMIDVAR